jgi:hypothetical protein
LEPEKEKKKKVKGRGSEKTYIKKKVNVARHCLIVLLGQGACQNS